MRRFILFFFFLNFVFTSKGQVLINEYSAANFASFADNYGEYEDWVELYNSSGTNVDLAGWALSDKAGNPTKWVFPGSFNIPAGGVAIIYCSGRDEISGLNAHTNFKLTQTRGNEVIMLSDASGVLQDSIRIQPHKTSHSRGREVNGGLNWAVFEMATPNNNNMGAMQEYTEKPVFSQNSGYYSGAINLTLTSSNPNNTIYYTTNGDRPNNFSNVYAGPININSTTIVKAICYNSQTNTPSSFIEYNTYFINDTHTIPILSVSGDSVDVLIEDGVETLGSWWNGVPHEPKGTIEWFDKNGNLLDKGRGDFNKHGNDSWAYDQRGFDYIMRDQFGYNYALQDEIFMTKDRDKFQRLILKPAANDNFSFQDGAHIRDAYVHHLSQLADLRMDERSHTSCIVYLNGSYWGVYEVREKVDDHDFTDYYYDQDANNLQFLKTWGNTWSEYGGAQAQTDWDNFVNFVTTNNMTNQANYNLVKSQYNTGSLIDYFLLNSYVVASDWLNWNTAWWRGMDPDGDKKKWRYKLWDMDATFDHYINYSWPGSWQATTTNDPCEPADLLNDPGGQGHVPIWRALLENEEFHDDYINRWQDLANGALSCSFMVNLLDSMINVIDPEMPRQIATWGGGSYADWQSNVTDLRNFILARCDSMNSGFVDCDTAITGIYNVTLEIIGVGEVEMSNNLVSDLNTPFIDDRFGGINLPFEVKSGPFDRWEVISSTSYTYDPNVDTLVLNLQSDVIVQAYFIPPIPTRDITYDINLVGTSTSITANGTLITNFPTTITYNLGDTVNVSPTIDPLFGFNNWESDSVILMPSNMNPITSFYATNHDIVKLNIYELPTVSAFISGNDTICDNYGDASVYVSFSGTPPYSFIYSVNGEPQPAITTTVNPHIISTKEHGFYSLDYFADANEIGGISGEALVTVLESPTAVFSAIPDTMTILNSSTQLIDQSEGEIISWVWDFGDNSALSFSQNASHSYKDSIAIYQVSLIISDKMGCTDTAIKHLTISDDYWIYIPNSFTPDSDQINDKLCISYNGIREESFLFNIYNRNSEVVFSTNSIAELNCNNGWEGRHQETNKKLPQGIYVYTIYYQDFEGWKHQSTSTINLIR